MNFRCCDMTLTWLIGTKSEFTWMYLKNESVLVDFFQIHNFDLTAILARNTFLKVNYSVKSEFFSFFFTPATLKHWDMGNILFMHDFKIHVFIINLKIFIYSNVHIFLVWHIFLCSQVTQILNFSGLSPQTNMCLEAAKFTVTETSFPDLQFSFGSWILSLASDMSLIFFEVTTSLHKILEKSCQLNKSKEA